MRTARLAKRLEEPKKSRSGFPNRKMWKNSEIGLETHYFHYLLCLYLKSGSVEVLFSWGAQVSVKKSKNLFDHVLRTENCNTRVKSICYCYL